MGQARCKSKSCVDGPNDRRRVPPNITGTYQCCRVLRPEPMKTSEALVACRQRPQLRCYLHCYHLIKFPTHYQAGVDGRVGSSVHWKNYSRKALQVLSQPLGAALRHHQSHGGLSTLNFLKTTCMHAHTTRSPYLLSHFIITLTHLLVKMRAFLCLLFCQG